MTTKNKLSKEELQAFVRGKKEDLKRRRFEDIDLRCLPVGELEYSISDCDGLSIRVYPNGKISFQYRYHLSKWKSGKSSRYTYKPNYPVLSLKEVRKKHFRATNMVADDIDLNRIEKEARKKEQSALTI